MACSVEWFVARSNSDVSFIRQKRLYGNCLLNKTSSLVWFALFTKSFLNAIERSEVFETYLSMFSIKSIFAIHASY